MELAWHELGQGPRTLVAVHCSLAFGKAWAGVAKALDGRMQVLACDMPGHGASPDWRPGDAELQGLTADAVVARMEALSGPAHLVGHSFGGTVALRVALERPDLVASLTLIEPVFFAAAFAHDPASRAVYEAQFTGFGDAYRRGDLRSAAREFTSIWGGGVPWEALPEPQRQMMADRIHLIPAGEPGIIDDVGGMLALGRLEALSCPVTLIEGAESPPIVSAIQTALAARVAHASRHVIEGAGHMVPLSHPAEVARLIG
ncbi:alpha/beta fold hydrolase [Pseudaestuariivita sp.]|uniref:alpha/beta fold hydrolase n=1 Tax=Pseudaestuariivita sp. TaxID=2211669 RepID=UPI004059476E